MLQWYWWLFRQVSAGQHTPFGPSTPVEPDIPTDALTWRGAPLTWRGGLSDLAVDYIVPGVGYDHSTHP